MPAPLFRQSAGFTLIELMVVIVLIGIVFTFAALSIGGDDVAELMEQEARRLVSLVDLAGEEAIVRGEELAIQFTDEGYTFLVAGDSGWTALQDDGLFKPRTLPPGIELRLEVEGKLPPLQMHDPDAENKDDAMVPQVYVLSSGEITPFTVILQSESSDARYHMTASQLGDLGWGAEETP
jgi:general secretion pathway protein H